MEDINLIKKPFISYTLDKDRKKQKFRNINIRSNPEMDKKINDIKEDLHIDQESTAIKKAFEAGYNVIHKQLGKVFFKGLLNKKEQKKSKFLRI